jgi:hypothetical protein
MPLGRDFVMTAGAGLTTTGDDADLLVSATEVAVTVTFKGAETEDGAL